MDRVDFLGFVLLIRDISRLDRYSTQQINLVVSHLFGRSLRIPNRLTANQYGEELH
jgi:hypothetical protein